MSGINTAAARLEARDWSVSHKGRRPGVRPSAAWVNDLCDELDRLRAIEAAARTVLATGQAQYDHPADPGGHEPVWTGDLVPADAMRALRSAVAGDAHRLATAAAADPPKLRVIDPGDVVNPGGIDDIRSAGVAIAEATTTACTREPRQAGQRGRAR